MGCVARLRNREAGQAALEDFLKRLDACSRDLDLRVTLGIKQSSQQLKEETASIITLLQEDGGATPAPGSVRHLRREFLSKPVRTIRAMCLEVGLPTDGTKAELVDRFLFVLRLRLERNGQHG